MEVLYLLVPLAVVLAGVIVWAFFWSVKSGQFDDLDGPGAPYPDGPTTAGKPDSPPRQRQKK